MVIVDLNDMELLDDVPVKTKLFSFKAWQNTLAKINKHKNMQLF